ncbi:hypothetical protein N7495_004049 [Penicillium taxi]|uniref:uncharacterized protein n=1 Tax=Penicillium taxi TaxID=168475 RepID=UPI002545A579|nr:uncharacterized protein N7495_004048 [Penicillium taxi]XP_057064380.1 uncharacterized protein N7495_004049 [Penicillium taxi]KAJ5899304.1 hypothetical protein N7495_004048 [Penicillium taxi]KAJ5899305.1 hypothetical protein N7495_004049 [Penicillium taxi]
MKFSFAALAILATAASYGQQPAPAQYGQYYQPTQQQNKYSPAEEQAWHGCVNGLLDQFNLGNANSKAGCSFWSCLEEQAGKYNRGGALASLGQGVSLVCKASGFLPGFI